MVTAGAVIKKRTTKVQNRMRRKWRVIKEEKRKSVLIVAKTAVEARVFLVLLVGQENATLFYR